MSKYNIHPDLKKYNILKPIINIPAISIKNSMSRKKTRNMKVDENILRSFDSFLGFDNREIEVYIFEPKDIEDNSPALLYFHGGGFMIEGDGGQINIVCKYAELARCKVFFVNYRLAPKYPFPIGLEDCYSSLLWLDENIDRFKIDRNRIAIGGDSAGGNLATSVAQMTRDRNGPEIVFQMLIYPVTDERQDTKSMKKYTDTPFWNARANKKMWKLYLKDGVKGKKSYASPNEADDLTRLPNAYIEVAEFDCLRDEGLEYAKSLEADGVKVKLNKTKGTIHGFEIAENSEFVKEIINKRGNILREVFEKNK